MGFYHITFISFFVNMRPNEIMKLTYTRKTHSRVSIVLASVVVLLVSLLLVGEVQFDKNPKYKRHDIHMLIYPYLYGYINVCREMVCILYVHTYLQRSQFDWFSICTEIHKNLVCKHCYQFFHFSATHLQSCVHQPLPSSSMLWSQAKSTCTLEVADANVSCIVL